MQAPVSRNPISAPPGDSPSTLRIAMVTETFPPEINGVAMTTGRLREGLLQRGHAVQLVRPRQTEDKQRESVEERLLTVSGLRIPMYPELQAGLPAGRRLRKLWRRQRPDLVHIVTEGPLGWSALATARKLDIPAVAGFHTNFHRYSRYYRLGLLQPGVFAYLRHFHNRCAVTLVPTRALADELRAGGIRDIEVLARGIDTRLFSPERRDETLRRAWGVASDDMVVLYVGRLAAEKNPALVVESFDAMRAVNPRLRLVLVGDGPAAPRLRAERPDLLFAGTRTGIDLARHYASADVFLFPSLTETFGNVVLEAMASGLAVVAFDEAAAHQHVRSGESGLLAPSDAPGRFVDHAVSLARDFERVRRLGCQARKVIEPFDWDRIHDRLIDIYGRVIERRVGHDGIPRPSGSLERA